MSLILSWNWSLFSTWSHIQKVNIDKGMNIKRFGKFNELTEEEQMNSWTKFDIDEIIEYIEKTSNPTKKVR